MSCEGLIRRLGYECKEVADNILEVDTPFTFPNGEPIHFYLDGNGGDIVVHDNADTLAHLIGMGWDLADRRKWKTLQNTVAAFGFELQETGAIVSRAPHNIETALISNYVAAMLAVVEVEREYLGLSDEQITFVEEVEMYLKASDPKKALVLRPVVIGHSGRSHEFHFELDGALIEAAKPRTQSTGIILRKATDVKNEHGDKRIIVVIDDRQDEERAKAEIDILNNVVQVMRFTALARQGQMSPLIH